VITSTEDVAIYVEKVESLTTNTEEFAVFVEDDCVTETISKDDFHYPRCIGGRVGICDGFHCCKCAHATACHEIMG
jgi:hypothetical protein